MSTGSGLLSLVEEWNSTMFSLQTIDFSSQATEVSLETNKVSFQTTEVSIGSTLKGLLTISNDNSTADQGEFAESKVWETYEYIIVAWAPILFLGVPCNILAAIVMMGPHYRETSTGVYLFFLAIFDAMFLTMNSITKNFIEILTGKDLNTISLFTCKLYVYLLFTSKCLSAWFVVAVTFERLIVVCVPHKVKLISTRGRAWIMSILLILIVNGCLAYVPYTYGLRPSRFGDGQSCTIVNNKTLMQMIHKVVDLILYSVIPFFSLLVLNIILVLTVLRSRRVRVTAMSKKDAELRRMTATLLIVSFLFLLCTSPMGLFLALAAYIEWIQTIPQFRIIYYSLYCIQLSNSTLNFWVYCLSAPAFRKELCHIVRCGKPKPKSPYKIANIFKIGGSANGYQSKLNGQENGSLASSTTDVY